MFQRGPPYLGARLARNTQWPLGHHPVPLCFINISRADARPLPASYFSRRYLQRPREGTLPSWAGWQLDWLRLLRFFDPFQLGSHPAVEPRATTTGRVNISQRKRNDNYNHYPLVGTTSRSSRSCRPQNNCTARIDCEKCARRALVLTTVIFRAAIPRRSQLLRLTRGTTLNLFQQVRVGKTRTRGN